MKNTKIRSFSVTAKRLIPITELIPFPKEVAIASEQLELCDLSSLPPNVTLVTTIGSLKVLITKEATLSIKVGRTILPDDPLAQKYGARLVAKTMASATGFSPEDTLDAKRLPDVTSASWILPDKVDWWFDLPASATGAQIIGFVRASNESFLKATEQLLTTEAKTSE